MDLMYNIIDRLECENPEWDRLPLAEQIRIVDEAILELEAILSGRC